MIACFLVGTGQLYRTIVRITVESDSMPFLDWIVAYVSDG